MSAGQADIINALRNIPIFQGLEEDDYREIIPLLIRESYPVDSIIIKEGTRGDSMCIIFTGTVKVTRYQADNEDIFLQALYAGSYFGEFSLIDSMPRSASVTALDHTELFRLEKRSFDQLLARNQRIATAFYKNCLEETFSRFRNIISNFTFSQQIIKEKSSQLEEINRDLTLAQKIQDYFINAEFLDSDENLLGSIKHDYLYRPCIKIGGDFLTVTALDEHRAVVVIADVMGHGITASLATGVIKSAFTLALKQLGDKPARMLRFLSRHLHRVISQLYATCYYTVIDLESHTLTMGKAGHHHPLFWKHRLGEFAVIKANGTGLGLVRNPEFTESVLEFEKGDRLLFFTDGIIEQKNDNREMYSEARLRAVFRELILTGENNIPDRLFADLRDFSGEEHQEDDVTLLALEF